MTGEIIKIAFINPAVNECTGGTEVFIREIAKRLAKKHEIIIITGKIKNSDKEEIWDSVERIELPYINRASLLARIGAIPWWWWRVDFESVSLFVSFLFNKDAKKKLDDCDVIATFYPTDSLLFSRYAINKGIPALYHCNGWYGPPIICWKRFFKYDKSQVYLATSIITREKMEQISGIRFDGIITPGIPSYILEDYNKPYKDQKTILFVGRLIEHKGIFNILEIYKNICKDFINIQLIYVGEGDARQKLEMKIAEEHIKNVKIIGKVPPEEVYFYYKSADIFLSAPEYESFGITVLEAMASGVPVICSDIQALREVTNGTSILLPRDNISEWIREIKKLLNDEKYRVMIEKKQRKQAEKYRWEEKASDFENYIYKIIR